MPASRERRHVNSKKPFDRDFDEIIDSLRHRLSDAEIAQLRSRLQSKIDDDTYTEVDYELKFLSIFTIRHRSRIGPSLTRLRFLVLLLPALMLALAIGGAIALVWLLGPKFHL